ncbi:MAG: FKBP-type peptidyl-prolyl cis-trans isomerase [Burkholderiales bacterium]|jgi:FKBP-type peptidyl-prolyl cis-trans isomerase FkpA/FKBP-type peptidyl-prolyl cis-trans isomerase FklB
MKYLVLGSLVLLIVGCTPPTAQEEAVKLETDEQKTLYAIGVAVSQQLQAFALSEEELKYVSAGLADGALDRPHKVEMKDYAPKIKELAQERIAVVVKRQADESKSLLEKAAAEPGAVTTKSGAIVVPITEGTGATPKAEDTVTVHYKGTLADGLVFDSSIDRGEPVTLPLSNVIKCWTEGVQEIKVGGKARLVCPADVAYGNRGAPPHIKPGATLIFEVELIDIVK